ncbi:MAG TPA: signal recognition particle-docking protein FtsY [Candidatus Poseidoniales archaeon]|nr:signal recognition particle-docking protein FtsY [Euryarchaeota archaeon]DAC26381.1 MAG TPA: signal recognition particle-docking protein FtsY [Candidatus Poseidoniales archaeon]HII58630.1 signal recognition particle-docking protein FtsY [Candidatus Poseidoniaceae archaeon]|tara:strand:- start:892 stop:2319 length:1428 start_codon:yes stop_codon:yes gene_type:complete
MGLFDRFKKRLSEVVDEVDTDAISAEGGSNEALDVLEQSKTASLTEEATSIPEPEDTSPITDEDDWEILDDEVNANAAVDEDDDWEDFDDDEDLIPRQLSRKEKKRQRKEQKRIEKAKKSYEKSMKKRGASEVARPKGSKVDLSMMRTTTGRKLVEVAQAPKGSTKSAEIATEAGSTIKVELGGGVVEQGGRVIKPSAALDNMLEELEWVLLESDISSDAVTAVINALKVNLIGSRLRKGADLSKVVEAALKRSLKGLLAAGYWDFDASVQSFIEAGDTPVVIMLVGVNGTGKTTTAAKIAKRLQNNNLTVIAAAGDTFRAGAIQQLEAHCENLGIRCVSTQRGGDTAAVARDAIESAQARGIDVVLVDTAGRMQNKTNLMNELNKVRRVANPHLTLFVGDSLAGNDAVDQARMFQEIMKFDGAVLTKLDTDAKGGAGLSIAFATGRPIVFAGVGQGYDDLKQFDPDWLLNQLFE